MRNKVGHMKAVFFAYTFLMLLFAMSFAMAPLLRRARTGSGGFAAVPLLVVLAATLLAIGLYAAIGRPDVASSKAEPHRSSAVKATHPRGDTGSKAASVTELLSGLEQRLRDNPDDAKGWLLLAKSYDHLGRSEDATDAYDRAVALGLSDGALEARLSGEAASTVDGSPSIRGRVSVSPAIAGDVTADDVVYVIARSSDGTPMPLAVQRYPASDLPFEFELSDKNTMVAGRGPARSGRITVSAKLSGSGDALDTRADIRAASREIDPDNHEFLELRIE